MRLIKILVETEDQAKQICEGVEELELNGDIDFGYSARITEYLTEEQASYNLMQEET